MSDESKVKVVAMIIGAMVMLGCAVTYGLVPRAGEGCGMCAIGGLFIVWWNSGEFIG